jgi:hypothetical protein
MARQSLESGGVMHFEEKKRRPLPIVIREVDCLGLQIRQDGLDGCAKRACPRRPIPGFDRDVHFDWGHWL